MTQKTKRLNGRQLVTAMRNLNVPLEKLAAGGLTELEVARIIRDATGWDYEHLYPFTLPPIERADWYKKHFQVSTHD